MAFFKTVKYFVLILELLSTENIFLLGKTVPSCVRTAFEQLFYHDLVNKLIFLAGSDGAFSDV